MGVPRCCIKYTGTLRIFYIFKRNTATSVKCCWIAIIKSSGPNYFISRSVMYYFRPRNTMKELLRHGGHAGLRKFGNLCIIIIFLRDFSLSNLKLHSPESQMGKHLSEFVLLLVLIVKTCSPTIFFLNGVWVPNSEFTIRFKFGNFPFGLWSFDSQGFFTWPRFHVSCSIVLIN